MADEPAKASAVLTTRGSASISLPPCELGWCDLISPKAFTKDAPLIGEGAPKYSADCHYTPAGLEALKVKVQAACLDAQLEALTKEATKQGTKLKGPIDIEEWLAGQLKTPSPKGKIQLPFIKIRQRGYRKDRQSGEAVRVIMGCWDADNNPLDLTKLRMGAGTVFQPIVYANLFASKPAMWVPQPSLKLVGVRVLKLVSFGPAGGPRAPGDVTDDEAIRKVLGADVDIHQDLSAYALGADAPPPPVNHEDDDDDSPF